MITRRTVFALVMILLLAFPTLAQTDEDWYGLRYQLPESWTSATTDTVPPKLVLGSEQAVANVLANQQPTGAVIIVEPTLQIRGMNFTTPYSRRETEEITFVIGEESYEGELYPPLNVTQMAQIYYVETFIITLAAPSLLWEGAQNQIAGVLQTFSFDTLTLPPEMLLGQTVIFGDILFDVPLNFRMNSLSETMRMYTTEVNRLTMGSTFRTDSLVIISYDLSALRPFIVDDNIDDFPDAFRYGFIPEITPETIYAIDDFAVGTYSGEIVFFSDDETVGSTLLLLDENSAYLIGAGASRDAWETSEEALFNAILATMRQLED